MHKIRLTHAHNSAFQIEERRRRVAGMLARSMTETEIAQQLNVDQSTISRDIKALKENSQQFVYDLAKSDLAYYYKQKLNSLDEAKREAWNICNNTNENTLNIDKVRLLALKLIITADEASIKLLSEGPVVLMYKSLDDRVAEVINNNNGRQADKNKV
jgi:DNA-binding transcriptional ArsR family regulator